MLASNDPETRSRGTAPAQGEVIVSSVKKTATMENLKVNPVVQARYLAIEHDLGLIVDKINALRTYFQHPPGRTEKISVEALLGPLYGESPQLPPPITRDDTLPTPTPFSEGGQAKITPTPQELEMEVVPETTNRDRNLGLIGANIQALCPYFRHLPKTDDRDDKRGISKETAPVAKSHSKMPQLEPKEVPLYHRSKRQLPNWGQFEEWTQGKALGKAKDPDACWNCGKYGHVRNECSEELQPHCYRCGRPRVSVRTCPTCGPKWKREEEEYRRANEEAAKRS
ncbi:uncharacterized protein LOC143215611 [Lasioglossum baleicum]|uniref:uncharacterized protein LOC143215611 n=1 Tax=Lasioglossum baleicum TaxID=434251 RepID=UPI003FCC738A